MSKRSITSSTAEANAEVQRMSAGGGVLGGVVGEPMPQHDLMRVRNVFTMLLDGGAMDPKKRDDISKRLEDMYGKLQGGHIKRNASEKLLQLVAAIEGQDYASAQRIQTDLFTCDWDLNKNWLMGIKRLIPTR